MRRLRYDCWGSCWPRWIQWTPTGPQLFHLPPFAAAPFSVALAAVSAAASAAAASFAALASTVSFAVSRRLPSWLPLLPELTRSQLLLQPLWLLHPLLPWLQLPILLYLLGCLLDCLCCCSLFCKHVVLLGGCFGLASNSCCSLVISADMLAELLISLMLVAS